MSIGIGCDVDLTRIPEIPHAVIDTRYENGKDLLRKYPGHYVTVRDELGAVYHVSKPGLNCLASSVRVAEGVLYKDGFDPESAPAYKNGRVLDFLNNKEYIYDYNGDVRVATIGEVA